MTKISFNIYHNPRCSKSRKALEILNSKTKNFKILSFITFFSILLIGCNGKLPGGDARKNSPDPAERIKKNLAEGRGFKLGGTGKKQGGTFEFASSNELWRASLDVIDFMPLTSVNYSGGIIITDWY